MLLQACYSDLSLSSAVCDHAVRLQPTVSVVTADTDTPVCKPSHTHTHSQTHTHTQSNTHPSAFPHIQIHPYTHTHTHTHTNALCAMITDQPRNMAIHLSVFIVCCVYTIFIYYICCVYTKHTKYALRNVHASESTCREPNTGSYSSVWTQIGE